jgi:hypothetical protein
MIRDIFVQGFSNKEILFHATSQRKSEYFEFVAPPMAGPLREPQRILLMNSQNRNSTLVSQSFRIAGSQ